MEDYNMMLTLFAADVVKTIDEYRASLPYETFRDIELLVESMRWADIEREYSDRWAKELLG